MTAGSIAAPVIVPLKIPLGAKRHESKHIVDQGTPIAITSDSKDTTLYYTINGTKPDPFQRSGQKYTYLYQTPFTLPVTEKAITVRAIAISSDGHKESNVVTKNYIVRPLPEASLNSSSNKLVTFSTSTPTVMPASASSTGPQYLLNRLGPKTKPDVASLPVGTSQSKETSLTVHAPSDYKTCVYCNERRPDDLHAKFCPRCGKLLPFLPSSKPEIQPTIGLSVCGGCRAMVPVGSTACVVCEAPIDPPPRLPVINAQLNSLDDIKGKPVCLACGTVNGAEMKICVTCEKPLESHLTDKNDKERSDSVMSTAGNTFLRTTDQSGVYLLCSVCGRINAPDARFCDWCGIKPSGPKQPVVCANCSATNSWESRHCVSCSAHIRPPSRHGLDITPSMKIPISDLVDSGGWVPLLDTANEGPAICDTASQTEGIFYPSSRTINKAMAATEAVLTTWTTVKKPSGAYSPGRGYWRQQLDHICLHLKAYTQSCPDFQAAVGKPQMGKLLSATLHDEDTELKVHLTYQLKPSYRGTDMLGQTVNSHDTKMLSAMLADSASSILSEDSTVMDTTNTTIGSHRATSRRKKKRKKKRIAKDGTAKLMEELSMRGDKDEVERLLKEEGADPSGTTPAGLPFLSLAAINGYHHCLPTLVAYNANVNEQNKKTGNTALHEVILGGPGHLECIKTLLNLGVNINIRNKAGRTACELAAEKRYDKVVTCIASHKGASLLRKLCKPSPHDITV